MEVDGAERWRESGGDGDGGIGHVYLIPKISAIAGNEIIVADINRNFFPCRQRNSSAYWSTLIGRKMIEPES